MSAWDVAGAVVWTALTLWLGWLTIGHYLTKRRPLSLGDNNFAAPLGTALSSFPAVFCIARLCGAHA